MNPKISRITLGMPDLTASLAFSRTASALRRTITKRARRWWCSPWPPTWLGLVPREALAADTGVPATGEGFREFTLAHNVATRAEVDAAFAQARKAGATDVKPPAEVF